MCESTYFFLFLIIGIQLLPLFLASIQKPQLLIKQRRPVVVVEMESEHGIDHLQHIPFAFRHGEPEIVAEFFEANGSKVLEVELLHGELIILVLNIF